MFLEIHWLWTNFVGLLFACGMLAWHFRTRIGFLGALLWFLTLAQGLRNFQYPFTWFPNIGVMISSSGGQAFSQALLIPLLALLAPKNCLRYCTAILLGVEIFLLSVTPWVNDYYHLSASASWGLLNARSMDGGFIAAILPLAGLNMWWLALPVIFATRGATAFLVFFAQLWTIAIHQGKKVIAALVIASVILGLVAYLSQGEKLTSDSGRMVEWAFFMKWWFDQGLTSIGMGLGSFSVLAPLIRPSSAIGETWLQLHNDWLQILWEGGWLLFIPTVIFYIILVYKARSRPRLLASIIGVGVLGFTYFPLRFFPSSFWICLLIREILTPPVELKDSEVANAR